MHAHARNIVIDTEAGQRISLGALFASFTPRERIRWDRWTGQASMDEFGIHLAGVERFLCEVERKQHQEMFG
jgi:hypothetical protein